MQFIGIMLSLFARGGRPRRKSVRYRPEVTALEGRWLPSTIAEFPLPPGFGAATAITGGPDGNLWFTQNRAIGRITPAGQVTEFPTPTFDAAAITAGPDGNLWFTQGFLTFNGDQVVGRITPTGQVTGFALPDEFAQPNGITAGPDGNVWMTVNNYPSGEKVVRITPTGQVTEFPIPSPPQFGGIGSITAGPDGNLWFTHDGTLARITPTGALTDHVADETGTLTAGPDGNLWVAGTRFNLQTGAILGGHIDRIGLDGSVTTFPLDGADMALNSIGPGPDGNLWFTQPDANQVGRITPAGQITLFPVPTPGSQPRWVAAGSNGNVWFTEAASTHIGEVLLTGTPPAPALATVTGLAIDVSAPAVGQAVHMTARVTSAAVTPGGTVIFFDGTTVLGTTSLDASGVAVLATVFHTAGNHSLTAEYIGTPAFAPSQSPALQVTVSPAATTTTLTASANPVAVGQTLVLTVKVTPAFTGAGAPTGTVMLKDGSNTIGFAALDASGHAVFRFLAGRSLRNRGGSTSVLLRGTHHLTVSYLGDGNFAASVSAQLDLTVV
jgi:streptogramin lyase